MAYLLYNDGVQTFISQATVYAEAELGLGPSVLIIAVLLAQFVAVGGALGMGALGQRLGAKLVRSRSPNGRHSAGGRLGEGRSS